MGFRFEGLGFRFEGLGFRGPCDTVKALGLG